MWTFSPHEFHGFDKSYLHQPPCRQNALNALFSKSSAKWVSSKSPRKSPLTPSLQLWFAWIRLVCRPVVEKGFKIICQWDGSPQGSRHLNLDCNFVSLGCKPVALIFFYKTCFISNDPPHDIILLHIWSCLSYSLTFFVIKCGGDVEERKTVMKSRVLLSLDFITVILSSSSLVSVVLVEAKRWPLRSGVRRSIWPIW